MKLAAKGKIDLAKVNKNRAVVLCLRKETGYRMESYFRKRGILCRAFVEPKKFYLELKNAGSVFVFISEQHNNSFVKLMPDYIVAKFNSPVILFKEDENLETHLKRSVVNPEKEIISIKGGIDQLVNATKKFEKVLTEHENAQVIRSGIIDRLNSTINKQPLLEEMSIGFLKKISTNDNSQWVTRLEDDKSKYNLMSMRIQHSTGLGYFLIVMPIETANEDVGRFLEAQVKDSLSSELVIDPLSRNMSSLGVNQLLKDSQDQFYINWKKTDVMVIYFADKDPSLIENYLTKIQIGSEHTMVPIEKWWVSNPLPCDAFILMENSKKKVLYIRSGDTIRPEVYQRFIKNRFTHLFLNDEDKMSFFHYRSLVVAAS